MLLYDYATDSYIRTGLLRYQTTHFLFHIYIKKAHDKNRTMREREGLFQLRCLDYGYIVCIIKCMDLYVL